MTDSLERAIKTIVRVAEPDKIILFGSHVKGDFEAGSDYDLLVLKRGVVADLEKFEELKNDPYLIYFEAAKNGRMVYEKS